MYYATIIVNPSVYKSQNTHVSKVPNPGVGIQCQNTHCQDSQIPTPSGLTLRGALQVFFDILNVYVTTRLRAMRQTKYDFLSLGS
jgi:hypothetical protein